MKKVGNFKKPFNLAFVVIWLFSQYVGPNFAFAQTTERFSVTATATVRVGNPPDLCGIIELQDSSQTWSETEKVLINTLCQELAVAPQFASLVGAAGTVTLQRVANGSLDEGICGSAASANTIQIACSLADQPLANYVIIHELGHIIAANNDAVYNNYEESVFTQEGCLPTYPFDCSGLPSEGFAEMIADYVVYKTYNFPVRDWDGDGNPEYSGGPFTNYPIQYPVHYNFAKQQIFGGVVF